MAKRKNPAAVALGRKGGQVRGIAKGFALLSPERRLEIAHQAVAAREARRKSKVKTKA